MSTEQQLSSEQQANGQQTAVEPTASAESPDHFVDIRPYYDEEVADVINNLLNTEEFISAIAQFRFPVLSRVCGSLMRILVKRALSKQLAGVDSVAKMQDVIAHYMLRMIERTTDKLTYSGLEHLKPDEAYLFISNHRDIAMDPAFVNWGLYHHGLPTVRIAIGDNLLKKDYVSDLMRLNKSFIVKRSATGVREKMKAYTELSSYIDYSIGHGHSIWIAQREGRAKDGNDFTEPAIMKMLYMSQKKSGLSFPEAIKKLHIVPVSISYEYDPCDALKARELYELTHKGEYQKGQFEDIDSIVQGITGQKGDVHVAFGEPLKGDYASAEELTAAIDAAILQQYYLHTSNKLAADAGASVDSEKAEAFKARLAAVPEDYRVAFLNMYANPVRNQAAANKPAGADA